MTQETYKTRLLDERGQLEERLTKLSEFLSGTRVSELSPQQLGLLKAQFSIMGLYLKVLKQRVALLN